MPDELYEIAKSYFENSKGSHDWEHTLRVQNLAMHIGKSENVDLEVLNSAALLHDIGRTEEDRHKGEFCHAKYGSKLASDILKRYNYSDEFIESVKHCILSHRFRGEDAPCSKEAKVLFDADKLDSIGAVGIGRAFLFAGEVGANLHDKNVDIHNTKPYTKEDTAYREFLVKLCKVKDSMMTKEGKRLAEERHRFMEEFFKRLNKEVDGET
ncbi:MAG: HD domain-containing protein [Nanoarchaeota archaeon]